MGPSLGHAQSKLPDKALRILVGFSAGGGAELMARVIAPRLEARTSRRVTVDNKPNDRDEPAGEFLHKGLKEGSVVAFLPTTTIAATLEREVFPFDSRSELVPLTMAGEFQVALAVASSSKITSFADYLAWIKSGPPDHRQLGTSATDMYLKLYAMMIGREAGVALEDVPHKNAATLVADLKSGAMPAGLGSVATLLEHSRTGGIRMLMTSGAKRATVLRTTPSAAELGVPHLQLQEWYGFFASSSTPPAIAAEWSRQLQVILHEPEVIAQLAQFGLDANPSTQAEAVASFKARLQDWQDKRAALGIKPPG